MSTRSATTRARPRRAPSRRRALLRRVAWLLAAVVVADEATRRERAGARGHAALDERTSRQLTQEEKAARATYTVANSGTIEDLEQTLAGVLEKLN